MTRQNDIPQHLEELIILFLQREISEADMQVLSDWLKQDHSLRRYFEEISTTFQLAVAGSRFNEKKTDSAWQALTQRIDEEGSGLENPAQEQ
jgi:hypothetical protein